MSGATPGARPYCLSETRAKNTKKAIAAPIKIRCAVMSLKRYTPRTALTESRAMPTVRSISAGVMISGGAK